MILLADVTDYTLGIFFVENKQQFFEDFCFKNKMFLFSNAQQRERVKWGDGIN